MTEVGQPKLFSTRDLVLAAALMSKGFKIAGIDYQIEGSNPKEIAYFSFVETEALTETIGQYLGEELLVEARKFMNNIRTLKAECVSNYKNPRR